jgi:S-adenosylmethionine hydrolase
MPAPIGLITDFGLDDWYVGVMKSVVLTVNPAAKIVDLTHGVPPQDITAANFAVLASYRYLPPCSVIAVIVDPGVGGKRKILCARSAARTFVFPDNGVLTEVLDREPPDALVSVENPEFFLEHVSATFHGRDIFAPVAAHLSLGTDMERLGPATDAYVRVRIPSPEIGDGCATVRVRWIDRFGNLITDCPADIVAQVSEKWGGIALDLGAPGRAPLVTAYDTVRPGQAMGIIGSSGRLEVSVREGSAARVLGLSLGDTIILCTP